MREPFATVGPMTFFLASAPLPMLDPRTERAGALERQQEWSAHAGLPQRKQFSVPKAPAPNARCRPETQGPPQLLCGRRAFYCRNEQAQRALNAHSSYLKPNNLAMQKPLPLSVCMISGP